MTPAELRACLEALGWSQQRLARELGCHARTARHMIAGNITIAEPVVDWLHRMMTWQTRRPAPPKDWQRR